MLNSIVKGELSQNRPVYSCFVDFRKAFDFVDRELLFCSLSNNGITGNILWIIMEMYRNTQNVIWVNDCLTPAFISELGVKQGSTLSPTLFGSFINGLLQELCKKSKLGIKIKVNEYINVLAYADDIVLLSNTEEGLAKLLNNITKWCNNWRVKINVENSQEANLSLK